MNIKITKKNSHHLLGSSFLNNVQENEKTYKSGVDNIQTAIGPLFSLEFSNVTLKYTNEGAPALDHITFSVKKGERIGVDEIYQKKLMKF